MTKWGEPEEWFYNNIHLDTNECIIWPYAKDDKGYPLHKKLGKLHTKVCEIYYGPRPKGKYASHGPCHNTSCINFRHLSWQTKSQDALDRHRDGKMHHLFGKDNPNYRPHKHLFD